MHKFRILFFGIIEDFHTILRFFVTFAQFCRISPF